MVTLSRFFSNMLANPRRVGAVAPSSGKLAALMAAQLDPAGSGRVLELGPGTGALTQGLIARGFAPERIVAVEAEPRFAAHLRAHIPGLMLIEGDAFDPAHLERGPFVGVVSGLPLRNFPPEWGERLVRQTLEHLPAGAPFVQFTYGLRAPVKAMPGIAYRKAGRIWANLPPASVWVYRRG